MSIVSMFRKEALKHQYKSQEFGEAVIQQPSVLNQGILLLLFIALCFTIAIVVIPLATAKGYEVRSHDSNFQPVVLPKDVIVEDFAIYDGAQVTPNSIIGQVRYYPNNSLEQQHQALKSLYKGTFFVSAEVGTNVSALQPIAKVLRDNPNNVYHFLVADESLQITENNQEVELSSGSLSAHGRVVAVSAGLQGGTKVSVRLVPPFDKAMLNPNHAIHLTAVQNRNNVLDLLRSR